MQRGKGGISYISRIWPGGGLAEIEVEQNKRSFFKELASFGRDAGGGKGSNV